MNTIEERALTMFDKIVLSVGIGGARLWKSEVDNGVTGLYYTSDKIYPHKVIIYSSYDEDVVDCEIDDIMEHIEKKGIGDIDDMASAIVSDGHGINLDFTL